MSYIDARYVKDNDEILVVERVNGTRVYKTLPAKYVFYYEDQQAGRYKDMWGNPVSQVVCTTHKQFQKELRSQGSRKIHESDIKPIFRCLEEHYLGAEPPVLNVGFFDIEVDFDPKRGFASPWDPFSAVTAISVHMSHTGQLVTLVIKPNLPTTDKDHLSFEAAEAICNEFENTILCNDEEELLRLFLDLIEDCDILSGWNSKGFDIPYLVNRIERLLGKDYSKKLCLWGQRPKKRKYIQFKKEQETYELVGRVHLDYLDLYRKHNPQELHSYRLDFVAEVEVGDNKTPYEGSLDTLYKRDFKKFIEYNRQDVLLLHKIDVKKRFIELANQLAHTNTVLLPTTMGSVALIEQAIINEAHSQGLVVPNRRRDFSFDDDDQEDDKPVVGAYVAVPKIGIHQEIACCDINSLYPSTLRALNMGPETLMGQIRSDRTVALVESRLQQGWKPADVWHGIFATLEYDIVQRRSDEIITVDFEDGKTVDITGAALYDFIFKQGNPYCISSNGTIFRTDREAIIPGLLAKWYSQRKVMQFKEAVFDEALEDTKGFSLSSELVELVAAINPSTTPVFANLPDYIKAKDAAGLAGLIKQDKIKIDQGKLFILSAGGKEGKELKAFWNQRQQARKILLNSLYGALLNEGCRFYDQRIGQSVTLTGRSIAKHMNGKVNEVITGEYKHDGDAVIYADTDSVEGSTSINTSSSKMSIESLFHACEIKWSNEDKEYASTDKLTVEGFDPLTGMVTSEKINYVYRHRVSKPRFRITDDKDNSIVVTDDHSIMVDRGGQVIEIKPSALGVGDILITNLG